MMITRNMSKRIVSILLAAFILVSSLPISAEASVIAWGDCGNGITWELSDSGTLTISGNGDMENYYLPYNASQGTNAPWASYAEQIQNVVINSGVTSIGDLAFALCRNLSSATLPEGITYIGEAAFYMCSLTSVNIPDTVEYIGSEAFSFCKMDSITIPESVSEIKRNAFFCCKKLSKITFKGNAPKHDRIGIFSEDVHATAYYPAGNDTWTDYAMETLANDGNITWVSNSNQISNTPDTKALPEDYVGIIQQTIDNLLDIPWADTGYGALYDLDQNGIDELILVYTLRNEPYVARQVCSAYTMSNNKAVCLIDEEVLYGEAGGPSGHVAVVRDNGELRLALTGETGETGAIGDHPINRGGFWKLYEVKGSSAHVKTNVEYDYYRSNGDIQYNKSTSVFNGQKRSYEEYETWRDSLDEILMIHPYGYRLEDGEYMTLEVLLDYLREGSLGKIPASPTAPSESDNTSNDDTDMSCSLEDLEPIDYLALSSLAYHPFEAADKGLSIKQYLIQEGSWDSFWEKTEITNSELYAKIADWKICYYSENTDNGFSAVAFQNYQNKIVIAFRGSAPLPENWGTSDAGNDWLENDIPMIVFNEISDKNQLGDALETYSDVLFEFDPLDIVVTGHSLGGGLADLVSARFGCRAESMNAISVLDVMYFKSPLEFGEHFVGVDLWNMQDHINQHDYLAGAFETISKPIIHRIPSAILEPSVTVKPFVSYKSRLWATDLLGNHGLESYVVKTDNGNVSLTEEAYRFTPTTAISKRLYSIYPWGEAAINLGTSFDDSFVSGLTQQVSHSSYGGSGNDVITTSIWDDSLIGGNGSDILDGGWGNDTYIYYKGHGVDTIYDVAGTDRLFLCGFSDSDKIEATAGNANSSFIEVLCNGELIVRIFKNYRSNSLISSDNFSIFRDIDDVYDEYDITSLFNKRQYSQHITISCPVSVEILDFDGNVVYTLEDGVAGTYYTDFGNFYIFEEEDGSYGKVLDLVEGYSLRIVGEDTGTMDVIYHDIKNGELTEPQMVSDIVVSSSVTAIIQKRNDNNLVLVADTDNDGVADQELAFSRNNEHSNEEIEHHSHTIMPLILIVSLIISIMFIFIFLKRKQHNGFLRVILVLTITAGILVACYFTIHFWTDATCTDAETCKLCGKERGAALGHDWQQATCTDPSTCSRCGKTDGTPAEHLWSDATCTQALTCQLCGTSEGTPLDHLWTAATHTAPKTCTSCGATEGTRLFADPIYLNELGVMSSHVGKVWTRSSNDPSDVFHTRKNPNWDNWDVPGHTTGTVRDNGGNERTYAIFIDGDDSQTYYMEFHLDGKYVTFSGYCASPDKQSAVSKYVHNSSTMYSKYFEVYGDGRYIGKSSDMRYDFAPKPFEFNVTGVDVLRIVYPESRGPNEIASIYDGLLE